MRICIYGAGAIGGWLGGRLALAGVDVSLVARGPHREAMAGNGLTLVEADGSTRQVSVRAVGAASGLGPQDYVIVTLKAHAVAAAVPDIQTVCGPDTSVVMAVNGVPWWYFYRLAGPWEGHRLQTVDPGDVQWNGITPERVLGCVVYPAAEVVAPGVVRHMEGNRFTLGEPAGGASLRAESLARVMVAAGLKAPVRPNIRDEIWFKLWGNLSLNPISALTLATLDVLCLDTGTREVIRSMMVEAAEIASALGVRMPMSVDRRIDAALAVGAHRTSMLQDLERGRPLEIPSLIGAVQELGRLLGVATPVIDTILALITMRANMAACASAG